MPKLVVSEWITLDGIFDAAYMGTWHAPFHSDQRAAEIQRSIDNCGAILLGRKTYEMLAPYWNSFRNNEMGIAAKLNSAPKFVVSPNADPSLWKNTTIIDSEPAAAILRLKSEPGDEILVLGSGTLCELLISTCLVDEFRFMIHPMFLGAGTRFFRDGLASGTLRLERAVQIEHGVQCLTYSPQSPTSG